MELESFDFTGMRENYECEFKLAIGKNGQGKLPDSFWETYSAFANTDGGFIFLGVEEKKGRFKAVGIPNAEQVLDELWNGLRNPTKVSANLLVNRDVTILEKDGIKILSVYVPRAIRQKRPVSINGNPVNSYMRYGEGDKKCTSEQIEAMIRDRGSSSADSIICENFTINDLNHETFRQYQNFFAKIHPVHPFNTKSPQEFLEAIGGYSRNRQTGKEGLTLAGLLMFGKLRSIWDFLPAFTLDFQEIEDERTRWVDRITTDFSGAENLFSFFLIVYGKLTQGLKVPFELDGPVRIDETPLHVALREALVNTLIHADYSGSRSLLIQRFPNMYRFQNPGSLLVPRSEIYRQTGVNASDCRNRNLQKMFQLIGMSEQIGSGFPKIFSAFQARSWKTPEIHELHNPEQTEVLLRLESLFPPEVVNFLIQKFGQEFNEIPHLGKVAMVSALTEKAVSHHRLAELTNRHPADISEQLQTLKKNGFLESDGNGPATFYFLPGMYPFQTDSQTLFEEMGKIPLEELLKPDWEEKNFMPNEQRSEHLAQRSIPNGQNSEHLAGRSEHLAGNLKHLKEIASQIREHKKVAKSEVRRVILELCTINPLSLSELANLLGRGIDTLRNHYVNPLCDADLLRRTHPNILNHPLQKYQTVAEVQTPND